MHYVRYFNLPSVEAQIIFRRALAAWAERQTGLRRAEAPAPVCAAAPTLPRAPRTSLELRVVG
jgi:alpha-D-ribose 1-methylphosphonate 5-triphosphate synthase subunit PhnH